MAAYKDVNAGNTDPLGNCRTQPRCASLSAALSRVRFEIAKRSSV